MPVSDGYFLQEPGLLYRKWPGQVTSQVAHAEATEFAARMRLIDARANALLTMTSTAPGPHITVLPESQRLDGS
jgi:hypothetical protein